MNGLTDGPQISPFSNQSIRRIVSDLLAAELSRSRGRPPMVLGVTAWSDETSLGEGGLDLDSLERLDASTALSEFFHLSDFGAEDYLLTLPRLGDWCELVAQSLTVGGTHLTFRTSGSTGAPKRCTHAVGDLAEEVASWARMLGSVERIVSLVPSHHIYGTLFTALLPDSLGLEVQSLRSGGASLMRSPPGTLVVATPTMWKHVARTCPSLPPGLVGISSTAPMSKELAEQLHGSGLCELIDIYGSSETGGIGFRRVPDDAYTLLEFWRHLGDGEVVRHGADGTVKHRMMDNSAWCDERHFRLGGRTDDAVQVGGTNVFPERVREMLLKHEEVADAAVRFEPSRDRLKAFIVLNRRGDEAVLVERIDRWCARTLIDVERPRSFTVGHEVPRDQMGKLADW